MLHLLAQTTQPASEEAKWAFWLVILTLILGIVAICQPIFGSLLNQIIGRLKEGDKQFVDQGKNLAVVSTKLEAMESDISEIKTDVKKAAEKTNDVGTEAGGSVAELAAKIERDFVRREHFDRYCTRSDDQHRETMNLLNKIMRGK